MYNLFDQPHDPVQILPKDGTALYYGKIFSEDDAAVYCKKLLTEIPWESDEALIFGKLIFTKRKVAWFGEKEYECTYSKRTKKALLFTPILLDLKKHCEEVSGFTYNSCLLNLYHDGSEGMAYHSDSEKDLKKHGAIASLSFGAERKFLFKHKNSGERTEIILENGSLLVMKDEIQENWLHRIPPSKKIISPRINLTFRTIES